MWRSAVIRAITCLAVVVAQPSVAADRPGSVEHARVVHVTDYPPDLSQKERGSLLRAFASLGYVEGRNLQFTTYDVASASAAQSLRPIQPSPGDQFGPNPYAALFATTIPAMRPHVILVAGPRAITAARESRIDTPVVFWRISDPVGLGLVATLPRPGGNLTGFSGATEKLAVKRLELLHEMVPNARQIAFLFIEDFPSHQRQAADVKAAATRIGVTVHEYAVPLAKWEPTELDAIFARMRGAGIGAFLSPDTTVMPPLVVELAARHRLPTIYALANMVMDLGGLAAYSTAADRPEDVARYAVRILRGERPADLPVQESARFEFVLNARAARAMGLDFPPAFLLRVNEVVEK